MLTLNSRRRAAVAIALISIALTSIAPTSHAATDPLANSSAVVFANGVQAAAISDTTAVPANPDGNSEIAFVPLQLNADGRYAFGARVNVTRAAGAQFASGIAVNPTNRNNIVVVGSGTEAVVNGGTPVQQDVIVAVSRNGGQTFTPRTVFGFGSPPAVTFDDFGNCYIAYRDRQNGDQAVLRILASSDGCATFVTVASANVGFFFLSSLTSAGAGVFASVGSSDSLVYVPATGLGAFGTATLRPVAALTPFSQALATGGDGQVVHARMQRNPTGGDFGLFFTPNCSLFVQVDPDGSGTATFTAPVLVTHATCFDPLRVLIDRSNSATRGRIYVLYVDNAGSEAARRPQSLLRISDDGGTTWSTGVELTTSTGQQLRPTGIDIDTAGRLVAVDGTQITTLPSALPRVLPDSPLNLQLQSATTGRVTIRWTDRATNETAYAVDRQSPVVSSDPLFPVVGLSPFEVIATLGADSTSFTDTQLAPSAQGQVFTYRVRALNNAGSSGDSNILAVRASTVALAAPGNATAIGVSQTQIRVDWQDLSNNETGFLIESSLDGFGFEAIATTGANTTSVVVGGFQPGTFRFFRVRATIAAGPSDPSNVTGAATLTAPPGTLAAPSDLVATSTRSGIILFWSDNSNNETQFEIQRGTNGVTFTTLRVVNANVTSFNDTSVTARRTFFYRVRALNNAANAPVRASAFTNVASARAR